MLSLNYDAKFDVLNIGIGKRENSIGDEEYGGLLVMRDRLSNIITGLTIFGFVQKYKSHRLPLWPDGIAIDVERDVLPYLNI